MGCYGGPHMRASYISPQAASVAPASVQAATRKALKYAALPTPHVFQPVAIDTLGPLDPSACDFINQIGSRMSAITGDRRETAFLFQRLSVVVFLSGWPIGPHRGPSGTLS